MSNQIADLTEIATQLLVNELARRAKSQNMTIEQLWDESRENWLKAEQGANDLLKAGHETKEAK